MAETGAWVPRGGVYEVVLALQRLAEAAGVEVRTGEAVTRIARGGVTTEAAHHPPTWSSAPSTPTGSPR